MTPSRRVIWQATSDGGNCWPHSAARQWHGRSWRARSSRCWLWDISTFTPLGAKRLGLLHELIPKAERVAAFINPNSAIAEPLIREAHAGASNIGWQVEVVHASTIGDIDVAFASLEQKRADAV